MGYDGKNVLVLPRGLRALNTRTNIVPEPKFIRYKVANEVRALKYQRRGYPLRLMPSTVISSLDSTPTGSPTLEDEIVGAQEGLHPSTFARMITFDFKSNKKGKQPQGSGHKRSLQSSEDSTAEDGGGYEGVYLPFGPEWTDPDKIQAFLARKHQAEQKRLDKKGIAEVPFFMLGSLDEVLHPSVESRFPFESLVE